MAALWAGSTLAQADVARITSVNGNYEPNRAEPFVNVIPGQVVNLTADMVNDYDFTQGENQSAQNFSWAASDRTGDACDLSQNQDCLAYSNFQANSYGVSFYVPGNAGAEIVISVRSLLNGSQDNIVLRNTYYNGTSVAPVVITDASQYPYSTFDPHLALYGQGNWVVIDGDNYFVPYNYASGWEPYQNGYWSTASEGYTWVSYDPWGWVTEHYGSWRHHGVYGWVWLPFAQPTYQPCAVSFFYGNGGYVGWYPYYSGFTYRSGFAAGFDDGFWAGYNAGDFYRNGGYHPGFTVVRQEYFGRENIYDIRETNVTIINNFYGNSYSNHYYGQYPGAGNFEDSKRWFGTRNVVIPETRSIEITGRAGVVFRQPAPIHEVPNQYKVVIQSRTQVVQQRPVPIGSQIRPGSEGARPEVIPPTSNGIGIAHPPMIKDPKTGESRPMDPVNSRPAMPNGNNPAERPPVERPIETPVQEPSRPVYNPPVQEPSRPVYNPPVQQQPSRPVYNPPVQEPSRPVYNPPVQEPSRPVYNPPVQQQPSRPVYGPQPDPAPRQSQPARSAPAAPSRGGGGGRPHQDE
jgi:hypothetical protein